MDSAGKTILVTGSTDGVGRHVALKLAAGGARVLVHGRNRERGESLLAEIRKRSGDAIFYPADLASLAEVRELAAAVRQDHRRLDALVNNAGIGGLGPFEEADEARLRQIMEVNFFAPSAFIREALPPLKKGNRAIIVNVSSVLGHRAIPEMSEYCASKFALHGLSDALRAELAPQGIDVLLVSPSTTTSEFFDVAAGDSGRSPKRYTAMSAEAVARRAVAAMAAGRHEIILSLGGHALVWFDRLLPSVADDALARWF